MVSLVTTYHELCISQEGGPGVITTTQLFQFWAKKLAHQRCAKILLTQQHDLAAHAKQ